MKREIKQRNKAGSMEVGMDSYFKQSGHRRSH